MAAAALTPRVRLATVCDRVRESPTEAGVYHLRGVRQRIVAPDFPFAASRLWLFLVLSSPRPGTYPGSVRVIDEATDKAVLFAHLEPHPRFEAVRDTLAAAARLRCTFPRPGRYTVQVWFYQEHGSDCPQSGNTPFRYEGRCLTHEKEDAEKNAGADPPGV
jgi:hypothetical protein